VSVLAHVLERHGLATTLVALVHPHAERQKPPRAVWVPYWYGRTFGAPNDPGLQRRVLSAALDLLERPSGPILESFEEEPPSAPDPETWSPVWAIDPVDDTISDEALADRFGRDVENLIPLHREAAQAHGWTLVGLSGRSLAELAALFSALLQ